MSAGINEFINNIARATTLKQLNQTLARYLAYHGISSYAFTVYQTHTRSGQKLIYEMTSAPLALWHQHYLDSGYADVDQTLTNTEVSLIPTFWDVQQQLTQAKKGREQRVREESIDFAIDKGLSIPLHGPDNWFAVLVLHQRKGEKGLQHYQTLQHEWISAATFYFHYFRHHFLQQSTPPQQRHLTKREQQCLQLTAEDIPINEIAKRLHISVRTVNFHLQNANKKLGVSNKYMAILKLNQ